MRNGLSVDNNVAAEQATAFLTNATSLQLLTPPEKKENVLQLTNAATWIDSAEEAELATEVLGKAINSVCYVFGGAFRDDKELHKAGVGKELEESVDLLICDPPYNLRR